MFELDIRDNIADVVRRVAARQKSIPVATSNALNLAALKVREQEIEVMKRVFDRPTRFTLGSLFVTRASVAELASKVFLKENVPGRHYLRPNIFGGGRLPKGFELAMRSAGLLPAGMYAVPGRGARLDSYGNMTRGHLMQVMSALRLAERTSGYSANRTTRSTRRRKRMSTYFVGRPGGGRLPLGVWEVSHRGRMGTGPVLLFVRQPMYQRRFNFFDVAKGVGSKAFLIYLERELRGIPAGRSLGL